MHRILFHFCYPLIIFVFLYLSACDRTPKGRTDTPIPGILLGQEGPLGRSIRVLLADGLQELGVKFVGSVDIVDSVSREVLESGVSLPELTFIFDESGIQGIEINRNFESPSIDLVFNESNSIAVQLPDGLKKYRGKLRLVREDEGRSLVVNILDLETYLIGVVAAELQKSFRKEAFRAQAIIARTYAWYQKRRYGKLREWDVKASEGSQVYAGLEREKLVPQARRAVRDTRGLVCTWTSPEGERIFCTYYSSRCGGTTQASGPVKHEKVIAPLAGNVICWYCRRHPYSWESVRIEKSLLTEQLRDRYQKFNSIGPIDDLKVWSETSAGRPVMLSLIDSEGQAIELEAENFRLVVDPSGRMVKSTMFVPMVEDDAIILTEGRGFGHGMGMCQYGANDLAKEGWKAGEILRYYYPTSRLSRAYE
ncbi:MAG: SpoIID/LytB domain-containing protein [Planctomycetota bacterium]|nr:MAG: SpoIID/LytB domain-containing protein [Planctomycetota bacterium]